MPTPHTDPPAVSADPPLRQLKDFTDEDFARARQLWADGMTLGDIARDMHCSIYALSPWLMKPQFDELNRRVEAILAAQAVAEDDDED